MYRLFFFLGFAVVAAVGFEIISNMILEPIFVMGASGPTQFSILSTYMLDIIVGVLRNPNHFLTSIESNQELTALIGRVAAIIGLSIFVSILIVFRRSPVKKLQRHIAGMKILSGTAAIEAARTKYEKEIGGDRHSKLSKIYLAPDMPITPNQETYGIFIEGGTGSGKTVVIEYLVQQAIDRGDKIILYDVKGDFAPKIKARLVLNPFAVGSTVWAVARDVKTADQARQLARMLIPAQSGNDDFWNKAAHAILSGILVTLQEELPGRWTFRDVLWLLTGSREALLKKFEAHYQIATMFLADKGKASNTEHGVLASLAAELGPFIETLAIAWGNPAEQAEGFSFEQWLLSEASGPQVLVLQSSPEHSDTSAAWIRMAINYLAGIVISPRIENDGPLRLWLVIDELPSLGPVPRLTEIVDRGRQKGVRTVVACQSLAQIEVHYADWARSAEGTFGTRILGRMSPGERTQSINKSLGEQYTEEETVTTNRNADGSINRSARPTINRLPVLSPEVLGTLGAQEGRGIDALIVGLTSNVLRAHWPFPEKRPNYHPPFRLAVLDRRILVRPTEIDAKSKSVISKTIGLKLDDALDNFDKG
jgi:type IV secretory pathway TraG/TraD family ATPase VirD4